MVVVAVRHTGNGRRSHAVNIALRRLLGPAGAAPGRAGVRRLVHRNKISAVAEILSRSSPCREAPARAARPRSAAAAKNPPVAFEGGLAHELPSTPGNRGWPVPASPGCVALAGLAAINSATSGSSRKSRGHTSVRVGQQSHCVGWMIEDLLGMGDRLSVGLPPRIVVAEGDVTECPCSLLYADVAPDRAQVVVEVRPR